MAIDIKCSSTSLYIEKVDNHEIQIFYKFIKVSLYNHEKIQDLSFRTYHSFDGSYEPECCIEIALEKGGSNIIFRFAYEERYEVINLYEKLLDLVKDFY